MKAIVLLLCVGASGAAFALWLVDHPQALPHAGVWMAVGMGVFFLCGTTALVLFLARRDRLRAQRRTPMVADVVDPDKPLLSVYDLQPGMDYRVLQPFTDYYGNSLAAGELLQFRDRHFLPYEGGHTLVFAQRLLYLQEERNREVLENFPAWFAPAARGSAHDHLR